MFSFESMKNCKNDRLFKIHKKYENSVNIRPRVQAISPKVYIGVVLSIRKRIKHVLKVCNVVFSFESMKNCKNDILLKIHKKYENSVNIRPRVQAISSKVYIGVVLSIRKRIKHVLKVCNVVFSFESMKIVKMTDFSKFIKNMKTQ